MRSIVSARARLVALGIGVFAATAAIPAAVQAGATLGSAAPIVIAHRGASGYLPEHTLAAYELAIRMGADYIEPDLQLTKDGQLVAMHDDTLGRTTNVAQLFAPRNGGYAVSEFTLAEIKTLTVLPTGTASTAYPGFTPSSPDAFKVPTFQEVIDLAKQQSALTGRTIGLYPEAKQASPVMEDQILATLKANGYGAPGDKVFIQSFSNATIRSLAEKMAAEGMDLNLVLLGAAVTAAGPGGAPLFLMGTTGNQTLSLTDLAAYADGIGVVVNFGQFPVSEAFIAAAHEAGLLVHGWTFADANAATAVPNLLQFFDRGMDGVFANYPDLAVAARAAVPTPSRLGLLGLGMLGLAWRRRARR
jgi:glycerophosphoryl diester phosphodiesterase